MTVNYENGKIYQLVNFVNDYVYVGSTCGSISKRLHNHKRKYLSGQAATRKLYQILRVPAGVRDSTLFAEAQRPQSKRHPARPSPHARGGDALGPLRTAFCRDSVLSFGSHLVLIVRRLATYSNRLARGRIYGSIDAMDLRGSRRLLGCHSRPARRRWGRCLGGKSVVNSSPERPFAVRASSAGRCGHPLINS
jgi:hypothetical protein